jgi:iron uptake system component EfeO
VIAACSGAPAATSGPASALPSGAIAVVATEYAFAPSTITLPAGPALFVVNNRGAVEHQFEVFKGEQLVGDIKSIAPGATGDLPLALGAGGYTFICKLSGHDQLGMKGTLTVSGG